MDRGGREVKVKPYRICDICRNEYQKKSGCMRIEVKRLQYPDYSDSLHFFNRMDICPVCGELLTDWIRNRREQNDN